MTDQLVRILDEEGIIMPDRLRLLMLFLLFRDGLIPADISKLMAHAQLAAPEGEVLRNLNLLGARIHRPLKDASPIKQPLFTRAAPGRPTNPEEDYSLSRFQPGLKSLLEEHCRGTLDQEAFPYTKPQLEASDMTIGDAGQASLRSAKPTWAKTRGTNVNEPRQRVIVLMAGGATYSESRACYETNRDLNKDVYLLTSHMITPALFLRQVGDLSQDKRKLGIPAEQPKPQAPAHLFEPEPQAMPSPAQQNAPPPIQSQPPRQQPQQQPVAPQAPSAAMATMQIGGNPRPSTANSLAPSANSASSTVKSGKDGEKKKKLFSFGSKK
jgi:syntaxin-binding protein 1